VPDLEFKVTGVGSAARGLTPLLNFQLAITNQPAPQPIQSVLLRAQIQIASPQRDYSEAEKERLAELFGQPAQWGQTLRNRLWTNASTSVGPFVGTTETLLPVPCSYDLNFAATKYFYAVADEAVPLLFLFSGTVFYDGPDGALQVQPIPWTRECAYRMPIQVWQEMMNEHFPNSAWLYLNRDVFERLYAYRRRHGLGTWEQSIERLLLAAAGTEGDA
jgi:hypothetical protein